MNRQGYILLHRQILDSEVFADAGLFHTWTMLLLQCNWKAAAFKGLTIKPGQLVFAWRELPERLQGPMLKPLSIGTLRRRIEALSDLKMVSVESFNRYSVLTIVNWSKYQRTVSKTATASGTAADTTVGTDIRREKKEKKQSPLRFDAADFAFAEFMFARVQPLSPYQKPNLQKWANAIRVMREQDLLSLDAIEQVFTWANASDFWRCFILSPEKLRDKFVTLDAQMRSLRKPTGHCNQKQRDPITIPFNPKDAI